MRLCAVRALFSRAYLSIVVVVSCFCEVVFDCLGICLLSLSCLLCLRSCVRLLGFLNINVQAWSTSSVSIGMAEKRKICNLEAYDNYVRKFKSDWEAAGLFISDKDILCKKEEVNKLRKHWANRMGLLRNKWSKLSQAKKLDNNTKEAFRSYQTEIFYELATIQENLDTPLSSASSCEESPPAVVGGISGCLSMEDHLLACVFTEGAAVQNVHDSACN